MRAGYRVALGKPLLGDAAAIDAYIARVARDMPMLADGFDPLVHETVPGTTETRWTAWSPPVLDAAGMTIVLERGEPWEWGAPLPEWAQGALLWVTVEIRTRGKAR